MPIHMEQPAWQDIENVTPSSASAEGMETKQADFHDVRLVRQMADITFKDNGSYQQKLQLLLSEVRSEEELRPLVVFIRGSGWQTQDVIGGIPQLVPLARKNYVIASVPYRSVEEAPFPAQIEDGYDALDFLVQHAESMAVDPNKIILWGTSSGAHTALLMSLMQEREKHPNIAALINYFAPADIFFHPASYLHFKETMEKLLDGPIDETNPNLKRADILNYIQKETEIPPMLIVHGDQDAGVPFEASVTLYQKLKDAEKQARLIQIQGAGHGGAPFWTEDMMQEIDTFIKEVL